MRSTLTITITVIFFMGMAKAADPTLLAETGGFLLGNASRCGVPIERVEHAGKAIHDFITVAANDPNEAVAADRRFAEIFLANALPEPNPRAFPSCEVVRQQLERLERHHEEARKSGGTPAASPGF
jgi:hypothetical protein